MQMLLHVVNLLLGLVLIAKSMIDSCLSRAACRFWLIMMIGA